jgi:sterol 3beta-glucosyltransferase
VATTSRFASHLFARATELSFCEQIAIPYPAILDVDRSTAMNFSETIEVKVVDQDDHFAIDSYFFAYFSSLPGALEQIRDAVRAHRGHVGATSPLPVLDTTQPRSPGHSGTFGLPADGSSPSPGTESMPGVTRPSTFRLSSLWSGRSVTTPSPKSRSAGTPLPSVREQASGGTETFTHITTREDGAFVPLSASPSQGLPPQAHPRTDSTHTYPPSPTPSETLHAGASHRDASTSSGWGAAMPSWLKLGGLGTSHDPSSPDALVSSPGAGVSEVYTRGPTQATNQDLAFSVLEAPGVQVDLAMQEKFRSTFAFAEDEKLLGCKAFQLERTRARSSTDFCTDFPGYIYRLIPVFGRLYISEHYFCFKAGGPINGKTRASLPLYWDDCELRQVFQMIIPIRDIFSTERSGAFHFGSHGLVINLRGHEELFFEFSQASLRSAFATLLERRKEALRKEPATDEPSDKDTRGTLIFEDYEPGSSSQHSDAQSALEDALARSAADPMFTSASSTFLRFKPDRPLHFTFLTIGSRGDVQPYIALAKGLIADGHRARIATHGEFREWVEAVSVLF